MMSILQKLEDDLKKMGLKIKHHEDNLKFLKSQINSIEESVIDMQGWFTTLLPMQLLRQMPWCNCQLDVYIFFFIKTKMQKPIE